MSHWGLESEFNHLSPWDAKQPGKYRARDVLTALAAILAQVTVHYWFSSSPYDEAVNGLHLTWCLNQPQEAYWWVDTRERLLFFKDTAVWIPMWNSNWQSSGQKNVPFSSPLFLISWKQLKYSDILCTHLQYMEMDKIAWWKQMHHQAEILSHAVFLLLLF